ncbi:hypothetical protein LP415_20760 [Polaromonas sp. P1(28)-8]|nr:hypothetical protein LP415_20760 [Polaromonas sp. P1(28)-8]
MTPHSSLLFARLARWLAPVAWALALLAFCVPAHATPFTAADEKSVRTVVEVRRAF